MQDKPVTDLRKTYIRKSNDFVTAKYKIPLLGNKIIALSLAKLQETKSGELVAELTAAELRKVLGKTSDSNFYRRLKDLSTTLAGHVMVYDTGPNSFNVFSIITNAVYKNKVLTITYNKEMRPHILDLEDRYTTFATAALIGFKKNATFRLYEVLKKECFRLAKQDVVRKEFDIDELRCEIGLVNMDAKYIVQAKNRGASYADIVKMAKKEDKQYTTFYDLRKQVLDPAQKEINESSDLYFDYELERAGAGGKVRGIIFTIVKNESGVEKQAMHNEIINRLSEIQTRQTSHMDIQRREAYEDILRALETSGIKSLSGYGEKYFDSLMEAADGDTEIIKEEIQYGKSVPNIKNYFGWLLEAVRNRYSKSEVIETVNGSTEQADIANEFRESMDYAYAKEAMDSPTRTVDIIPAYKDPDEIWSRYKTSRKHAAMIVKFANSLGVPREDLEDLYDSAELLTMYLDFKNKINYSEELAK